MTEPTQPARVVVTDIHMQFGSMVALLVKLALAAIPALLILSVVGMIAFVVLSAFFTR
jgi:hypothetical protein